MVYTIPLIILPYDRIKRGFAPPVKEWYEALFQQ